MQTLRGTCVSVRECAPLPSSCVQTSAGMTGEGLKWSAACSPFSGQLIPY